MVANKSLSKDIKRHSLIDDLASMKQLKICSKFNASRVWKSSFKYSAFPKRNIEDFQNGTKEYLKFIVSHCTNLPTF